MTAYAKRYLDAQTHDDLHNLIKELINENTQLKKDNLYYRNIEIQLNINQRFKLVFKEDDHPMAFDDYKIKNNLLYFMTITFDPERFDNLIFTTEQQQKDYILASLYEFKDRINFIYGCFEKHKNGIIHTHMIINFNDYQISGSWINNFGSMCLDEDTTLVVVGGNNTLVKIEASRIETNSTITSVELQSQVSESHKVVYSPIISKFVIISDLGRVYTYDGSILSYITTIPSCIRILDVSYGNGVIYVVAKYITENDYAVFASSNLTSWVRGSTVGGVQTGIISSAYSKKLNKLLVTSAYVVGSSITAGANYFYYNGSTVSMYSAPILYELPFDLDYVNYTP